MWRRLCMILVALATVCQPIPHAWADSVYGSHTMGGVTFDVGTNGCLGPVVGVYGDDALKNYILGTAQDFCNAQLASGTSFSRAIDVEWMGMKTGGVGRSHAYFSEKL